jgi:hypothetical protein
MTAGGSAQRTDGRPCDGCGETIDPSETACTVSVQRALDWRFHEACYAAWLTFSRHSAIDSSLLREGMTTNPHA